MSWKNCSVPVDLNLMYEIGTRYASRYNTLHHLPNAEIEAIRFVCERAPCSYRPHLYDFWWFEMTKGDLRIVTPRFVKDYHSIPVFCSDVMKTLRAMHFELTDYSKTL